ncbi:MAG: hypothetical protein IKU80_01440 [Firmicutes bacterium]|nr:hypothetical protein [Bacillota bacterium]
MSYFIAVLIIVFIKFSLIIKSSRPKKSIAVFCEGKTGIKNIRKMKKLKNMGFEVFFAGKTTMENAVKKGVMKRDECFVTEREFEMLTEDEKEKLISFCRYYFQCSDAEKIKNKIGEKYKLLDIENSDVIKLYGQSVFRMIMEFIFLTEISLMTALITHKILTFCFN